MDCYDSLRVGSSEYWIVDLFERGVDCYLTSSSDGRKFSDAELLAILKLSARFMIREGRVFATRCLDTLELDDPHQRFICAVEFKVLHWFTPGFLKLARCPLHWVVEHYYPELGHGQRAFNASLMRFVARKVVE